MEQSIENLLGPFVLQCRLIQMFLYFFCPDSLCIREGRVLKSPTSAELGLAYIIKSSDTLFMRLNGLEFMYVCHMQCLLGSLFPS